MSETSNAQVLAVLTSPPSLEIPLVDWLLSRVGATGFSSTNVSGHSTRHEHLSIAEQVSGRQRRVQIQVQLDSAELDEFLESLQQEFAGADLHFWVMPILAAGRLS